ANGWNEVVVEVFGTARNIFFHQREPDALRDAALNLPFRQKRVDRAANIMRRRDLDQLHCAKLQINLKLSNLRAPAINGVRLALPLGVERYGRRIIAFT